MKYAMILFLLIPFATWSQSTITPSEINIDTRKIQILLRKIRPLDTEVWNELRLNKPRGAMMTGLVLYDAFGNWDEVIKEPKPNDLILVWKNIKLFENSA